eukprot:5060503-Prymnesium_polylepis.1
MHTALPARHADVAAARSSPPTRAAAVRARTRADYPAAPRPANPWPSARLVLSSMSHLSRARVPNPCQHRTAVLSWR